MVLRNEGFQRDGDGLVKSAGFGGAEHGTLRMRVDAEGAQSTARSTAFFNRLAQIRNHSSPFSA